MVSRWLGQGGRAHPHPFPAISAVIPAGSLGRRELSVWTFPHTPEEGTLPRGREPPSGVCGEVNAGLTVVSTAPRLVRRTAHAGEVQCAGRRAGRAAECRNNEGDVGMAGQQQAGALARSPEHSQQSRSGHATERAWGGFRGEVAAGWAGGL